MDRYLTLVLRSYLRAGERGVTGWLRWQESLSLARYHVMSTQGAKIGIQKVPTYFVLITYSTKYSIIINRPNQFLINLHSASRASRGSSVRCSVVMWDGSGDNLESI